MKDCPVCGAAAFDDALTCFGCLHRFESEATDPAGMPVEKEERCSYGAHARSVPEFLIRFTPGTDTTGALVWSCAVEA